MTTNDSASTEPGSTEELDRPEVWISRCTRRGSEDGPLAGVRIAVKDNIDVAGAPTTAACISLAQGPATTDAPAVSRLLEAGALVVGKTNMDQFATGLVGTRSPWGAVRNAIDPRLVSGGSSSGSAVAVAMGEADAALGTDTAGSGRVPAAFNHIVGLKPTLGLVSSRGVVPACKSYDTVSVFARTLGDAVPVLRTIIGPDEEDPRSRTWPDSTPLAAPSQPVVAVPLPEQLEVCEPAVGAAFADAVEALVGKGIEVLPYDITPLLSAAALLYGGALVAERYEAYGAFADAHPADLDPAVSQIIDSARRWTGWEVVHDQHELLKAKVAARELFEVASALMVPTTPIHPSIEAVQADPLGLNSTIGTYTNFVNLLDLAGVAVPSTDDPTITTDGVTFVVPAFHDQVALDIAARLRGEEVPLLPTVGVDVVVFGAHMRGLPLSPQLPALGARFIRDVTTAAKYRMGLIPGTIQRPGVTSGTTALPGELWRVPAARLSKLLLESFAPPLGLGQVELDDGSVVLGCLSSQVPEQELPHGWRVHLAS